MLCYAGKLEDGLHCGVSVCGCWSHSSVWAAFGCGFFWLIAKCPALSPADRTPPPSQTSSLEILPPKRFSSFLTSSHFIPPPFPLFVCICRPSASPLTLHREQSQGSKVRLCLSLFHSLSLSRFVLSIEPLPLGPSALSVSLWPADLCFVSCMTTHFYPGGWCSDAPSDRVSI